MFYIVRLFSDRISENRIRILTWVNIICFIRELSNSWVSRCTRNSSNLFATIPFVFVFVYRLLVHQVLPRPDACFPSSDKNRSLFVRISRIGEVLGMQIPAPRSFLFARCYTPRVCMKRSKVAAVPSSFCLFSSSSSSFQSYSRDSI